jgi:formate hydrogenlyase subunit 3/multisubunit Na+/H+ antiporter MnhD subunit
MEQRAAALVIVFAAIILAAVRFLAPAPASLPLGAFIPVPPMLVVAVGVAAAALLMASLAKRTAGKIPLWPCALIVGGLCVAGLVVSNPWLRLGLLEAAALLTIVRVWIAARSTGAKFAYLAVVLVSAGSMVASELLDSPQNQLWSRALFFTSVCVKLAAVPLFFWLLRLADELPALVLGLIIAVVDMAAFGELYVAAHASPDMFTPTALWIGVAAVTSLLAALLMLTQRSLKRLLVLSTVEDAGFLIFGIASISALGTTGALVAAVTHSIAKALLFICLAGPEADGALEDNPKGLATRYPVAAFGFLFGMLAMLGIPPTIGFIGRWKLYETAVVFGWPVGAVFILASIMALIAYVLALTGIWWGPRSNDANASEASEPTTKEPFLLQTTIVLLVVLILAAGVWPGLLDMLHWGRL